MSEPLDLTRRLRAWTYRRQQLGRSTAGPLGALRAGGAVTHAAP